MSNKESLTGKVALITGASRGIGKEIALELSNAGADVIINYSSSDEKAEEVVNLIKKSGGKVHKLKFDVSEEESVSAAFEEIIKINGTIDILINNAGVSAIGNVENTTEETLDHLYSVNVKSIYNCAYAVIPIMRRDSRGGLIINLASVASSVGVSERFAYSMSKGAVLSMTMSIAKDYVNSGIRCNCVSPGRVHTPFVDNYLSKYYDDKSSQMFAELSKSQPIGRMGQPEEVAALVEYLCGPQATFITGSNFPIDGGFVTLNS